MWQGRSRGEEAPVAAVPLRPSGSLGLLPAGASLGAAAGEAVDGDHAQIGRLLHPQHALRVNEGGHRKVVVAGQEDVRLPRLLGAQRAQEVEHAL